MPADGEKVEGEKETEGRPFASPEPPISLRPLDSAPENLNCSKWDDVFLLEKGVVLEWSEGLQF